MFERVARYETGSVLPHADPCAVYVVVEGLSQGRE